MKRTRIAVALATLAITGLILFAPAWVLRLLAAWTLLSVVTAYLVGHAIASADRQLDRDERACDRAAKSRGKFAFHSNLYSTISERDHG